MLYAAGMSSERELFDAVVDAPDDKAPRDAFAAWAKTNDPPRAEFIHAQYDEVARRKAGKSDWTTPRRQAQALEKQHGRRWAGPIANMCSKYVFYRGFVEQLTIGAAEFLDHADKLYARAPVRHLSLTGVAAVAPRLFNSPHLDRIVSLSLQRNKLDDPQLGLLAASAHLGKLRWLDIGFNKLSKHGYELLIASSGLGALEYVNTVGNPGGDLGEEIGVDMLDGSIQGARSSKWARDLEAKHGRRRWLHIVEEKGRLPFRGEY